MAYSKDFMVYTSFVLLKKKKKKILVLPQNNQNVDGSLFPALPKQKQNTTGSTI